MPATERSDKKELPEKRKGKGKGKDTELRLY
jgi:hypothetical protein